MVVVGRATDEPVKGSCHAGETLNILLIVGGREPLNYEELSRVSLNTASGDEVTKKLS